MEILNLFDSKVKQDIIGRINKLTPDTQHLWGKMNVAQMLSHCQMPIAVAFGSHKLQGNFILKLIGPLFKSVLFNEKPYKHSLPTDKSFVIIETKDFELEKKLLLEKIENFTEKNMTDAGHPLFGKLTKEQWSKATWKHLDHHLRQFGV
jgi:hypothetical protein